MSMATTTVESKVSGSTSIDIAHYTAGYELSVTTGGRDNLNRHSHMLLVRFKLPRQPHMLYLHLLPWIQTCHITDRQRASFRWDNVFSAYILSIFMAALQFATSHDSTLTRMILSSIIIHFAFETSQSWYFTLSGKAPLYLSAMTITICVIEAILVWPMPETMAPLLNLQFLVSDSFSFVSCISMLFNKAMPQKMRIYAFSVSLHFIGPLNGVFQLHGKYYVSADSYDGGSWAIIGFTSLIQLILCREVVRGGFNDIGPVVYDEKKNSKYFILFSKYGAPLLCFVVLPVYMFFLKRFRTVPSEGLKWLDKPFAFWIWDDIISAVFWPMAMFGILWTVYLRATPNDTRSSKKQSFVEMLILTAYVSICCQNTTVCQSAWCVTWVKTRFPLFCFSMASFQNAKHMLFTQCIIIRISSWIDLCHFPPFVYYRFCQGILKALCIDISYYNLQCMNSGKANNLIKKRILITIP